jgi:hypothetical protein
MGNYDHLFKKTADAKATEGGIYVLPGLFIIEIDALKMITNFRNVDMFIAELSILKSNNPERPADTTMSWTAGYDKPSTPGNVKAFAQAVTEALFPGQGQEIDAAGMAQLVDEALNPARGVRLHLEAVNIKTQAKKTDFTKCIWRPLSPEEANEVGGAVNPAA